MQSPFRIFRPDQETDAKQSASIRDLIANCIKMLRESPVPDTFLGRKTQRPFPNQEETD